jgi:quercetin dioxygenase-like cupin family protein
MAEEIEQKEIVNNIYDRNWVDESTLAGARGYEFMAIHADDPGYTSTYSLEYTRLGPNDYSVPHVEPWNHLLYFVEGSGEVTVGDDTFPVRPGSYAKIRAGIRHSLKNLGGTDMLVMTIYDPPRQR